MTIRKWMKKRMENMMMALQKRRSEVTTRG
jgi:hypothetical protein